LWIETESWNVGLRKGNARAGGSTAHASTCSAKQIGVRVPNVISGNNDIHVVFKRQIDRILQAEVQFIVVN
jgi:hypothetical protein